jgi:hypothetical protein
MCGSAVPGNPRENCSRYECPVRANPTVLPERLARDLLVTVLSGPHVLVLSEAILNEIRRVLSYPRVQAR